MELTLLPSTNSVAMRYNECYMPCIICGAACNGKLRKGEWSYLRCSRCGLLSSDPIPSHQQIELHYRTKFQKGNYEAARRYATPYLRIYEQIATWVAPKHGERILDVGCFTGDLMARLAARGADVYGLELQPEAVEIAQEKMPGRVFKADVDGSAFPEGPYDTIMMSGVIEHVIDPAKFVSRAHSLLVPNGRLLLQTPDASSVLALIMRSHWPPLAPIEHIHLFSRSAMRKLLHSSGFSDVQFRIHIKTLPVGYVYENLSNFGPEWKRFLRPLHLLLGDTALPFYGGEMLISAVRG
jgi:SAM-dependent methyltransferase